ncbi:hypothetical protein LX81_03762 [Palleronia aestuarii]|uniref:Uncharacterized protein n=1 Tax=Palleronia aestuarii TaxID=568105 RepID=A0A2W7NFK8_9RHOB|nr:hypothetical protein LX81_03762 [Palleronia aestuarii]
MSLHSFDTVPLEMPGEPHGLDELVNPACKHAADPRLLDHGYERFLRCPARLEETGKVAPLPQLRHAQSQRPEPGVERAVAIAIAVGGPPLGPLVAAGADDALDVGLNDQLQDRLGDGTEEIALVVLLKQLGQAHGDLGHRRFFR